MSSKTCFFFQICLKLLGGGLSAAPIEKTSKLVKSDHFTPRNLWIHQTCSSTFVWNRTSRDCPTTHQWFSNLNYPHLSGVGSFTEGFNFEILDLDLFVSDRFWEITFCKAEGRGPVMATRHWKIQNLINQLQDHEIPCTQATRNVKHHN